MSSSLTDLISRRLTRARDKGLTKESDGRQGNPAGIPTTSDAPGNSALASLTPVKEKKTAEELASMIRQDLSEVDACPRRGVNVTVYGFNPWNSMLTFGVDAGPVHNKAHLQSFCDIITERLKRLYDI
jgi:hypothetical protein